MITLYRKKEDTKADSIEQKFRDLVLAYRTEIDSGIDSAYITEGNTKIEQGKNMEEWLRQLEQELAFQRSLSGDGCYIDPNTGKIC